MKEATEPFRRIARTIDRADDRTMDAIDPVTALKSVESCGIIL